MAKIKPVSPRIGVQIPPQVSPPNFQGLLTAARALSADSPAIDNSVLLEWYTAKGGEEMGNYVQSADENPNVFFAGDPEAAAKAEYEAEFSRLMEEGRTSEATALRPEQFRQGRYYADFEDQFMEFMNNLAAATLPEDLAVQAETIAMEILNKNVPTFSSAKAAYDKNLEHGAVLNAADIMTRMGEYQAAENIYQNALRADAITGEEFFAGVQGVREEADRSRIRMAVTTLFAQEVQAAQARGERPDIAAVRFAILEEVNQLDEIRGVTVDEEGRPTINGRPAGLTMDDARDYALAQLDILNEGVQMAEEQRQQRSKDIADGAEAIAREYWLANEMGHPFNREQAAREFHTARQAVADGLATRAHMAPVLNLYAQTLGRSDESFVSDVVRNRATLYMEEMFVDALINGKNAMQTFREAASATITVDGKAYPIPHTVYSKYFGPISAINTIPDLYETAANALRANPEMGPRITGYLQDSAPLLMSGDVDERIYIDNFKDFLLTSQIDNNFGRPGNVKPGDVFGAERGAEGRSTDNLYSLLTTPGGVLVTDPGYAREVYSAISFNLDQNYSPDANGLPSNRQAIIDALGIEGANAVQPFLKGRFAFIEKGNGQPMSVIPAGEMREIELDGRTRQVVFVQPLEYGFRRGPDGIDKNLSTNFLRGDGSGQYIAYFDEESGSVNLAHVQLAGGQRFSIIDAVDGYAFMNSDMARLDNDQFRGGDLVAPLGWNYIRENEMVWSRIAADPDVSDEELMRSLEWYDRSPSAGEVVSEVVGDPNEFFKSAEEAEDLIGKFYPAPGGAQNPNYIPAETPPPAPGPNLDAAIEAIDYTGRANKVVSEAEELGLSTSEAIAVMRDGKLQAAINSVETSIANGWNPSIQSVEDILGNQMRRRYPNEYNFVLNQIKALYGLE